MTELIWDGKYKDGKKVAPVRIALPFQTIETVSENATNRQKRLNSLFNQKQDTSEWQNRLIWGNKKNVLPNLHIALTSTLLHKIAGKKLYSRNYFVAL